MPLLSWIRLIDVHQNAVFEMGKNRWRARVTENRCKLFDQMFDGLQNLSNTTKLDQQDQTAPNKVANSEMFGHQTMFDASSETQGMPAHM